MIGIIVQLVLSWIIVWFFEKGNLSFLGFFPSRKRLRDFALFFLITALCCSSGFFLRMYFGKEQWEINPALNAGLVFEGTWWNITQGFLFSQGSIGNGIFIMVKPQPIVNVSYFIYFTIIFLPILSTWVINFLLLKRRK